MAAAIAMSADVWLVHGTCSVDSCLLRQSVSTVDRLLVTVSSTKMSLSLLVVVVITVCVTCAFCSFLFYVLLCTMLVQLMLGCYLILSIVAAVVVVVVVVVISLLVVVCGHSSMGYNCSSGRYLPITQINARCPINPYVIVLVD